MDEFANHRRGRTPPFDPEEASIDNTLQTVAEEGKNIPGDINSKENKALNSDNKVVANVDIAAKTRIPEGSDESSLSSKKGSNVEAVYNTLSRPANMATNSHGLRNSTETINLEKEKTFSFSEGNSAKKSSTGRDLSVFKLPVKEMRKFCRKVDIF